MILYNFESKPDTDMKRAPNIRRNKIIKPVTLTKYLRLTLVFIGNSAQWEKSNFCFFKSFLLVLTKLSFWHGDCALGNYAMGFRHFPDIS